MGSVVRFADVEVDLDGFRISRDGAVVRVEPQVFEVLRHLIEHRDRVVTKEELLDEVWRSRFVSESALSSRIKSARQAIGDDGRRQHLIATVHGRGYRFVGETTSAPSDSRHETRPGAASATGFTPSTDQDSGSAAEPTTTRLTVAPATLVERDPELELLADSWLAVRGGVGQTVVVRGEAGIGKSALIQTALDRLTASGADVAAAGCLPLRLPSPLAPIGALFSQWGATDPEHLADPAAAVAHLVRIAANAPGPIAVAIDDVHWADDATLDVLALLGRRARDLPLLLLIGLRDHEAPKDHPLWSILAGLRADGARFVELEPLSRAGVAALVDGTGAATDGLAERTGGNPLLITQLLAAPDEDVPGGVRDVVLARLAKLSASTVRATEALAMSPSPLELPVVMAYLSDDVAALDEAERQTLITLTGDRVAFRHELVREAVHDSVPMFRRLGLHRRLLDALPDTTSPARLLHHASEAAAFDVIRQLGPAAARRAAEAESHREACLLYERTLRHVEEFDDELVATLHTEYAYQLYTLWELKKAEMTADTAVGLWRGLDRPAGAAQALTILARAQVWRDPAGAIANCRDAVQLLRGSGHERDLAWALGELAGLHVVVEDHRSAKEIATEAYELGSKVADRSVEALALNYLGCVGSVEGDDDWEAMLRRSIELANEEKRREYSIRAYSNLAVCLWDRGRWLDSAAVIDEVEPLIAGVEYQAGVLALRLQAAHVTANAGRPEKALEMIDWITATELAADLEFECDVLSARTRMRLGDGAAVGDLRRMFQSTDVDEAWSGSWTAGSTSGRRTRSSFSTLALVVAVAELCWREGDSGLTERVLQIRDRVFKTVPWRTEKGELDLYLRLAGAVFEPAPDLIEPFATALGGDPLRAAAAFDEAGRPYDAEACRALDPGPIADRITQR